MVITAGCKFQLYLFNFLTQQLMWLDVAESQEPEYPKITQPAANVTDLKFSFAADLLCVLTRREVLIYSSRLVIIKVLCENPANMYRAMYRAFDFKHPTYGLLYSNGLKIIKQNDSHPDITKAIGKRFTRCSVDTSESIVYIHREQSDTVYLFDDQGEPHPKCRYLKLAYNKIPYLSYKGKLGIAKLDVVNTVKYALDCRLGKVLMY